MSPVDLGLWVAVAVLAAAAVAWSLPRPLEMDDELLFKLVLSTLERGREEAEGGDRDGWVRRVRRRVWYRPGARELGRRLLDPHGAVLPVPPRPGERAFLELLRRDDTPDARLRRAFLQDPRGDEVLFDDPELLGDAFDLRPVLGPEAGWDALASWSDAVVGGLRRRHAHLRWAVLGWPELTAALAGELGADRVVDLGAATGEGVEPEALTARLAELVPGGADRLVLVGVEDGAPALARSLHGAPALRDRVRAVVGINARLGGAAAAWLEENFHHAAMDTEISRATPYFHLAFAVPGQDPPGEAGVPLEHTAWPRPPTPPSGRVSIEPVDLGVLPGPRVEADVEALGRALLVTVTVRLVRGG